MTPEQEVFSIRYNQAVGYAYGYADAKRHAAGKTGAAVSNAMAFADYATTGEGQNKSLQDAYEQWSETLK